MFNAGDPQCLSFLMISQPLHQTTPPCLHALYCLCAQNIASLLACARCAAPSMCRYHPCSSQTASYVVWVTALLPFITLLILLIRAVTLPGAEDGIEAYLGRWDMAQLSHPGYEAPLTLTILAPAPANRYWHQ